MEWIFLKMILSLGAVLGLMFGLVYVLKRFVLPGGAAAQQGVTIEVLGRKVLQPKKSIVVLKIAERVLVVGMSEQGMQTLTELSSDELQQPGPVTRPVVSVAQPGGFAAHLQATLNTLVNRKLEKRSV